MLGTAAWHRTLLASGFDRIPGDLGDARLTVYVVEHWYQVFRGQAEPLSPDMFYPVKGTIGLSHPAKNAPRWPAFVAVRA